MMSLWKNGRIDRMMQKKIPVLLMNFSGIYKEADFWKDQDVTWIEAQDLTGTNCYCDDEAAAQITARIENLPAEGIHFIDSGNYHYLTKFWIEKIDRPFQLVVFDNHTDMQLPAFGGLLSCGGWIAAALEELENLSRVILIGPDEEAYEQVEDRFKEKVVFLSREKLRELKEELGAFLEDVIKNPLGTYISIDKDILCLEDAQTTWSQGDMQLSTLLFCVKKIRDCAQKTGTELLGVDICGEADVESLQDNRVNDYADQELLKALL